jgi:hypothetical protein
MYLFVRVEIERPLPSVQVLYPVGPRLYSGHTQLWSPHMQITRCLTARANKFFNTGIISQFQPNVYLLIVTNGN